MSRNYYSEINLHIVWHTKNSLPLLTAKGSENARKRAWRNTRCGTQRPRHECRGY